MTITLPWDSNYEIGQERVDFEHQIFLGLIRELSAESDAGAKGGRFERVLREMYHYAEFHFVSEENIMIDIGYPALGEHKCFHEMLLAELKDKMHGFRAGREPSDKIVSFLFQWFALHTTQADKRLAEFIRVAGSPATAPAA